MRDELESQITNLRDKLTQESDVIGKLLRYKENMSFSLKEISSLFKTEQNQFDIQALELSEEIEKIKNIVLIYAKTQSEVDTMSTYSHISSFGSSSESEGESDAIDLIDYGDDEVSLSSTLNETLEIEE